MRSHRLPAPARPALAMVIALTPPVVIAGLLAAATFGSAARSLRVVAVAGTLVLVFLVGHQRTPRRIATGQDTGGLPPPVRVGAAGHPATPSGRPDIVDEWGRDSFPASDPPANW